MAGAVLGVVLTAGPATASTVDRAVGVPAAVQTAAHDWRYCDALIYRKGRPYGRMLVKKVGKGQYRPLRGHLTYTRRAKPAVYRIDGKCADTLAALRPPRTTHQVPVVPRGGASTGAGGSQGVDPIVLGSGAALLSAGIVLILAGAVRRGRGLA